MFKKALSYLLIVFGLIILWASTSRHAMRYISDNRDTAAWWGTYQDVHGDLVSMSYLDLVSKFNRVKDHSFKCPDYTGPMNTDLYLDGDSYTYHLDEKAFAGVGNYHYLHRVDGEKYHLDTSKRNILVIEISERYIRDYFSTLRMIYEIHDTGLSRKGTAFRYVYPKQHQYASLLPGIHVDSFFNKYINQNLQFNLFNYECIMPVFEVKAALNYYLFNRASGDVVISNDRQYLFLKETVDPTDSNSSYAPLSAADEAHLVNNFNIIYDYYKKEGFSEVYLSMIPNSASILQPEGYNKLIPRIQNDPLLRMKVIDIYSVFSNSSQLYYCPGDTHWNDTGLRKWLALVNEKLIK